MSYTYNAAPTVTTRHATLTDLLTAARNSEDWRKPDDMGEAFAGGTKEEAIRYVEQGWPKGAKEASERAMRVVNRVMQSASALALVDNFQWDVTGASFDVGTYLSGDPECWLQPVQQPQRRAISICVNVSASGAVTAETLRTRGMAVATLVLALQSCGYPVTVDVCNVYITQEGEGRRAKSVTRASITRVIDANGAPLDVDRLVFAIAHPLVFRCLIRNSESRRYWDCGQPQTDSFPGEYDLTFGGAHLYQAARWHDGGEAWVMQEFERQVAR